MTKIEFIRDEQGYLGFSAKGHAGDMPEGENIVCAAISAAVELTECQLTDVLLLETDVRVDPKTASVSVNLKTAHAQAQAPIRALRMYLEELAQTYPRLIKITEVSHA